MQQADPRMEHKNGPLTCMEVHGSHQRRRSGASSLPGPLHRSAPVAGQRACFYFFYLFENFAEYCVTGCMLTPKKRVMRWIC